MLDTSKISPCAQYARPHYQVGKRIFDVVVSFVALVLLFPVFLIVYGALAARRAFGSATLAASIGAPMSLRAAVTTCLAFTYLNPHCWLDTVVLLGSISAQQPEGARAAFGSGATLASFVWFFALGYGARALRGLFERPMAWKTLDAIIALVMWAIAASLLLGR